MNKNTPRDFILSDKDLYIKELKRSDLDTRDSSLSNILNYVNWNCWIFNNGIQYFKI